MAVQNSCAIKLVEVQCQYAVIVSYRISLSIQLAHALLMSAIAILLLAWSVAQC